jgi:hypothetical protein
MDEKAKGGMAGLPFHKCRHKKYIHRYLRTTQKPRLRGQQPLARRWSKIMVRMDEKLPQDGCKTHTACQTPESL